MARIGSARPRHRAAGRRGCHCTLARTRERRASFSRSTLMRKFLRQARRWNASSRSPTAPNGNGLGFVSTTRTRLRVMASVRIEEVPCKERDVFFPRPQRRKSDLDAAQPEVEVGSERPGGDPRLDVGARGGQEAHIHDTLVKPSEATDHFCVEEPDQLRLKLQG